MNDQKVIEEVYGTFSACGAFFRDTTLSPATLAKYVPGVLLREPTFCDASYRSGGFVAQDRYLIFSSQARSLDSIADKPWGLCIWLRGRMFKVLDVPSDAMHTQVTLLEIPKHLLDVFLQVQPNEIERAFIEHGRQLFAELRNAPPLPELSTEEWCQRLLYPVGINDDGRYFPLNDTGDYADAQSRSLMARIICYSAGRLMEIGAYAEAEAQLQSDLDTQRSFAESDPRPTADLLVTLAELRIKIGDVRGAESDLHEAFKLRKRLGEDRVPVADVLSRLGNLYQQTGDLPAAERLHLHALKIKRRVAGSRSAEAFPSLVSLGALYDSLDRFEEAETQLQEALEVARELGKPNDPTLLNNLARVYQATGRHQEAIRHLRKAIAIVEPEQRGGHRHSVLSANLAEALAATGEAEEAFQILTDVVRSQRAMIFDVASFASEHQLLWLLRQMRIRVDQCISVVMQHFPDCRERTRWLVDLIIDRKALGIDILSLGRDEVLLERKPNLRETLARLHHVRARIAQQRLAGPGNGEIGGFREELREATLRRDALERELAQAVPDLAMSRLSAVADCRTVALALPPDAVAIEFLRYTPFHFTALRSRGENSHQPPRYLAIVLAQERPDSPVLVDVGDATTVDSLVAEMRSGITGSLEHPSPPFLREWQSAGQHRDEVLKAGAEQLTATLIDPLRNAFGRAKSLLIAPDGDLLRLPFEVLGGPAGQSLLDEYVVSYLTAARDAVRLAHQAPSTTKSSLVLAAPDYDAGSIEASGHPFPPLAGTEIEGRQVAELLGARALLGGAAMKTEIVGCRGPQVLHIATHGFVLSPESPLSPEELTPGMVVELSDGDRDLLVLDGILATPGSASTLASRAPSEVDWAWNHGSRCCRAHESPASAKAAGSSAACSVVWATRWAWTSANEAPRPKVGLL